MKRSILAALAAFSVLLALPVIASAHVTVSVDNATAGGYAILTVKVPHGCEGKGTNKINLKLPEGTASFAAARSPFWSSEVKMRKLDAPIKDAHGNEITELPDEVIYTGIGDALPDGDLDMLYGSIKLPDTTGDVFFPILQGCEGGAEAKWIQMAAKGEDPHALESPAPSVHLVAAGEEHDAADDDKDADKADDADDKSSDDDDTSNDKLEDDVQSARILGGAGLGAGLLGVIFGIVGMRRRK